jgi:hypothetical protein
MKFNQDILFEFLPEEDKKSFMVWDYVHLNMGKDRIVATYRSPFEERVIIPLDEYDARVKQKERDNKLNKIL